MWPEEMCMWTSQIVKRAKTLWETLPDRASSRDRISFTSGSFFVAGKPAPLHNPWILRRFMEE
jgi:hypothetical protein